VKRIKIVTKYGGECKVPVVKHSSEAPGDETKRGVEVMSVMLRTCTLYRYNRHTDLVSFIGGKHGWEFHPL
jgi:hypothetical protein